MSIAVTCSDLDFTWPSGESVFTGLNFTASTGSTGLIGLNGSGKSTLLKLIAGELLPADGSIRITGQVGYLPQDFTLEAGLRVDEVLRIATIRTALHAVERGEASEQNISTVGENWDVEERALAMLSRLGLEHIGLDRRVDELSGGESVLLGVAAELLKQPAVLLLDEPTNNLDLDARTRLYDAVATFKGAMLIVSHDRELLDLVDQIADLRGGDV